ncbi:MAG: DNA polymerase III subunit epsilon [Rhodospirillaceae bacterium]|nr:DNA polymerase III subunit epsilon [Rhodospirillaceae bacterium]
MREIVLDTETTGLDPKIGHRLVEIGAVELINHTPTGVNYQAYINPERDVDLGAQEVHGLTNEFLKQQPTFGDISAEFINFLSDSTLIIHNAPFDLAFINMELSNLGLASIHSERVIDTLLLARKKFPGAQASLDALCRRFSIDNRHRDLHGALVDAALLADVYIELIGGKEPTLGLSATKAKAVAADTTRVYRKPRSFPVSEEELELHRAFVKTLVNPIWGKT